MKQFKKLKIERLLMVNLVIIEIFKIFLNLK
jgi:hypothetical protein